MAPRIIGETPVAVATVICTRCGYLIEYTGEDVTPVCALGRTIKCPRPSCGATIQVPEFKVKVPSPDEMYLLVRARNERHNVALLGETMVYPLMTQCKACGQAYSYVGRLPPEALCHKCVSGL